MQQNHNYLPGAGFLGTNFLRAIFSGNHTTKVGTLPKGLPEWFTYCKNLIILIVVWKVGLCCYMFTSYIYVFKCGFTCTSEFCCTSESLCPRKVWKGSEAGFQGNCRPAGLAQRGKRGKFNDGHNRGRRKGGKKWEQVFRSWNANNFSHGPLPSGLPGLSCGFVDPRTKCPENLRFFAKLGFLLLPKLDFLRWGISTLPLLHLSKVSESRSASVFFFQKKFSRETYQGFMPQKICFEQPPNIQLQYTWQPCQWVRNICKETDCIILLEPAIYCIDYLSEQFRNRFEFRRKKCR